MGNLKLTYCKDLSKCNNKKTTNQIRKSAKDLNRNLKSIYDDKEAHEKDTLHN